MKGDDKDAIEAKTKTVTEASAKMAERLYAQQGGGAAEGTAGPGPDQGTEAGSSGRDEDVVDAEFEEVKDDKK
jgi:molecular chaperone DnaK